MTAQLAFFHCPVFLLPSLVVVTEMVKKLTHQKLRVHKVLSRTLHGSDGGTKFMKYRETGVSR